MSLFGVNRTNHIPQPQSQATKADSAKQSSSLGRLSFANLTAKIGNAVDDLSHSVSKAKSSLTGTHVANTKRASRERNWAARHRDDPKVTEKTVAFPSEGEKVKKKEPQRERPTLVYKLKQATGMNLGGPDFMQKRFSPGRINDARQRPQAGSR